MTTTEYRYDDETDAWSWYWETHGATDVAPTMTEQSSADGPALDPIHGPTEPNAVRIARTGHAPEVIGNAATTGTPTNWTRALPAWDAAHRSDVKVGHGKKGKTQLVTRHGRIMVDMVDMVDNDRAAHVAAMADDDYTRASEHELAQIATHWARMACEACSAVWEACERDHDDADYCKACASGCGCMPTLMGGTLVAYSEVIHAGEGAECAVAQRHGSLSDALSGMNLKPDQIREFRDQYVTESRTDGAAIVTRDESKLAWPTRYGLPAPAWRRSESDTWQGEYVDAPYGQGWDGRHYRDDATVIEATVTMLPSPCDVAYSTTDADGKAVTIADAPYFCGFVKYDDRGMLASDIRDHGRAIATGEQARARAALAETNDHPPIEVGETQTFPINGAIVRVTREGVAQYRIVRGKNRTSARTFTLAMRAVERLAS